MKSIYIYIYIYIYLSLWLKKASMYRFRNTQAVGNNKHKSQFILAVLEENLQNLHPYSSILV